MARSWQYSRSRRTLMQVIMWLVLAATVGGASLLARQRMQARMIQPEKAVRLLAVEVRLPAGWVHGTVLRQRVPPIIGAERIAVISATEFGRSRRDERRLEGRQLIFREEIVRDGMTAIEYLKGQGADEAGDAIAEQLADVGGQPGWMVVVPSERSDDGRRSPWAIFAAAILPTNRAVMIRMMGYGAMVPADREDVKRLAAYVRFVGTTRPASGPGTRPVSQPAE